MTVDGEIDLTTTDGEFRATMLAGIARFEVRRKADIEEAVIVQQPAREQHTIDLGVTSSRPPKHIREALARLL